MPDENEYYTMAEAVERLRCGEKAVLRMMKRCELPGQAHGKSFRFHREDVDALVERCERTNSWPDQRR